MLAFFTYSLSLLVFWPLAPMMIRRGLIGAGWIETDDARPSGPVVTFAAPSRTSARKEVVRPAAGFGRRHAG